jgi:hypothetical protein
MTVIDQLEGVQKVLKNAAERYRLGRISVGDLVSTLGHARDYCSELVNDRFGKKEKKMNARTISVAKHVAGMIARGDIGQLVKNLTDQGVSYDQAITRIRHAGGESYGALQKRVEAGARDEIAMAKKFGNTYGHTADMLAMAAVKKARNPANEQAAFTTPDTDQPPQSPRIDEFEADESLEGQSRRVVTRPDATDRARQTHHGVTDTGDEGWTGEDWTKADIDAETKRLTKLGMHPTKAALQAGTAAYRRLPKKSIGDE